MNIIYEFKVMIKDLYQDWENLPVVARVNESGLYPYRRDIIHMCKALAAGDGVVEVRYNVQGSPQGYYYPGKTSRWEPQEVA